MSNIDDCPQHPGQPRVLLCITDNSLLCLQCVVAHSKHELVPLSTTKYRPIKERLDALHNSTQKQIEYLTKLKEFCTDLKQKISKVIDDQITAIKSLTSEINAISKTSDTIIKRYSDEKKKYEALKTKENDEKLVGESESKYNSIETKCKEFISVTKSNIKEAINQSIKDKIKLLNESSQEYILSFLREGTNQIVLYDLELCQAKTILLTNNIPSGNIASLMYNKILYISGGFNGVQYQKTFISSQISSKELTCLAPMIYEKEGHSMCALNKEIYVIGGKNTQPLNKVFELIGLKNSH